MSFKEVQDLESDVTTALGGFNKKSGKPNPKKAEGYYIGSKKTVSKKSKSGFAMLHILQTEAGRLGVWGKTDLDRKMSSVVAGSMVRITQTGTQPTPNGDMYKFKVEVDAENSIEVSLPSGPQSSAEDVAYASGDGESTSAYEESEEEETEALEEEAPVDEIAPARAVAPKKVLSTPDAARAAKVQALLAGSRAKAS